MLRHRELKEKDTSAKRQVTLQSLPQTLFSELEQSIKTTSKTLHQNHDANKLKAITAVNTKVAVKWTERDDMGSWKPGWYIATVQSYNPLNDQIAIEYCSELGNVYHMSVKGSIAEGILQVAECPSVEADLYDAYTEIGARILIKWDKDEVCESGWKPGWYAAEVQLFYPQDDKNSLEGVYSENVTELITHWKIKLAA